MSGEPEQTPELDRNAFIEEIGRLVGVLIRQGVNIGGLRQTARAISEGAQNVPDDVLAGARDELLTLSQRFQKRETVQGSRISSIRKWGAAAVVAAFVAGAVAQKACDSRGAPDGESAAPAGETHRRAQKPTNVLAPGLVPHHIAPSQPPAVAARPHMPAATDVRSVPHSPATPLKPKANPRPKARASAKAAPPLPPPVPPRARRPVDNPPDSAEPSDSAVRILTDANFEREIAHGIYVVDFYADWCGPCKSAGPYFDQMAQLYGRRGVKWARVNVDGNPAAYRKFSHGKGIPLFVFLVNGKEVARKVGFSLNPSAFVSEMARKLSRIGISPP